MRPLLSIFPALLLALPAPSVEGAIVNAPRWKVLALIYTETDVSFTCWTDEDPTNDAQCPPGSSHRVVASATQAEIDSAVEQLHEFIDVSIPSLTSGNQRPILSIEFPSRVLGASDLVQETVPGTYFLWGDNLPLSELQRDDYDSIILIWKAHGSDVLDGNKTRFLNAVGGRGGAWFGWAMFQLPIELVDGPFQKHEWGHAISGHYEGRGLSGGWTQGHNHKPKRYLSCRSHKHAFLHQDTRDREHVPNSSYNNLEGFSHAYYSGTIAPSGMCADDQDCPGSTCRGAPEFDVCLDESRAICTSDADCPNSVCSAGRNHLPLSVCNSNPSCASDADCSVGRCNTAHGRCTHNPVLMNRCMGVSSHAWANGGQVTRPTGDELPPPGTWYVSDLIYTTFTNAAGPIERDQTNGGLRVNDGQPIIISGTAYAKGLGVHAPSALILNLGGQCTRFKAKAGGQDGLGANVVFRVTADTEVLFDSVFAGPQAPLDIDVDVSGRDSLILIVQDAGGGTFNDQVNWAEARVECGVVSACGNGILETGEECDDNNLAPLDGCDTSCQLNLPSGAHWLSDLEWLEERRGPGGSAERDASVNTLAPGDGNPLTINGQTYAKGIGVHARSEIGIGLWGQCQRFSALLGVDDEVPGGEVTFVLRGDGQELYRSEVVTNATPALAVSLPVDGIRALSLIVEPTGVGGDPSLSWDHADWALAAVRCGTTSVCGDGIMDDGEECDDGNPNTGDGCTPACVAELGPRTGVSVQDGKLMVMSPPGLTSNLSLEGDRLFFSVRDTGAPLDAMEGCTSLGAFEVECNFAGIEEVVISTGNLNDVIAVLTYLPTTINAGNGNDVILGGFGDDHINGGPGADLIFGFEGRDTVDYSLRFEPLVISAGSGFGNDGGPADSNSDTVGSDIEVVLGGSGADQISSVVPIEIHGGPGNDVLTGSDQPDHLLGGPGDDELHGGDGSDRLDGGSGADLIFGDGGTLDLVDYSMRSAPVSVTFDGNADDGEAGEGDNVNDDVEDFTVPFGTPLYIDPATGDDSRSRNEAQDPNTPWKTLNRARRSLSAGDAWLLAPGTYEDDYIQVRKPNVTVRGLGASAADVVVRPHRRKDCVEVRASGVTIENFTCIGGKRGVRSLEAHDLVLRDLVLNAPSHSALYLIKSDRASLEFIQGSALEAGKSYAFFVTRSEDLFVRDVFLRGFVRGVRLSSVTGDVGFMTIDGMERDGIRLSRAPVALHHSLITNINGGSFVETNSPSADIHHVLIWNALYEPVLRDASFGEGMLFEDPLYTGELFLSQTAAGQAVDSPALNAGAGNVGPLGVTGTTRSDGVQDRHKADLGAHRRLPPAENPEFGFPD